jgi:hypothetical protein
MRESVGDVLNQLNSDVAQVGLLRLTKPVAEL